jgi:signal transduction histidine kinase/CheY-like chemotaxis protein
MKVALLTPNDADRSLAARFIEGEGIECVACASIEALVSTIGADTGCVVMVEEALDEAELPGFREAIEAQPPWSDLPLLLIAAQESALGVLLERLFPGTGNVTLLQRPLHPVTLLSAVNMALRSRQRQYEVRALLEERARAVKQRDEFLAMLAHELRNPLAPIRNAAYILNAIEIDDPVFRKCRLMIEKQTSHIARLVDDLLDVSRLELGKVELRLKSVDLSQCVSAAIEACVPLTSAQRHHIDVRLAAEPLVVRADPVRMEQVLGNLVLNAAKFTPEGGTIRIETLRDGDEGVVRVVDNGRGIEPHMLASVFELFVQAENSLARTGGGLGIGLTLVKRLVEMHGGSVSVASDGLGCGARFETRFPLAAPDADRAPGGAQADEPARRSKRVLVIEDVAESRESLGLMLSRWKHDVIYAVDGPQGIAKARETRPDVAIIDIGLPGVDGYEVARRIRGDELPWARQVKLVALTGYGQAQDRHRALEAGFDDHLLKPVEPATLERLLLG